MFRVDTVISTWLGIGKTRDCVETRRPKGGVFSHNYKFPNFHYTEKCFIFFTKKYKERNFPCWHWLISTRLLANQRSVFTNAIYIIKTDIKLCKSRKSECMDTARLIGVKSMKSEKSEWQLCFRSSRLISESIFLMYYLAVMSLIYRANVTV